MKVSFLLQYQLDPSFSYRSWLVWFPLRHIELLPLRPLQKQVSVIRGNLKRRNVIKIRVHIMNHASKSFYRYHYVYFTQCEPYPTVRPGYSAEVYRYHYVYFTQCEPYLTVRPGYSDEVYRYHYVYFTQCEPYLTVRPGYSDEVYRYHYVYFTQCEPYLTVRPGYSDG